MSEGQRGVRVRSRVAIATVVSLVATVLAVGSAGPALAEDPVDCNVGSVRYRLRRRCRRSLPSC